MCIRLIRVTVMITLTLRIGRIRASGFIFRGGPFSTGTPISATDAPSSAVVLDIPLPVVALGTEAGFIFHRPTLRVSGPALIPPSASIKEEAFGKNGRAT